MSRLFSCWILLGFLLVSVAAAAEKPDVTRCTMIPLWLPQAQFAGYYAAVEKGIYRKHGIDMVMLKGGPDSGAAEYLKDGLADFAVLWLTTAIRQYDQGLCLVHLGQMIPRSSMLLVSKKNQNIRLPEDMNGRTVGIWDGDLAIPPRAFFERFDLRVREIPQSYTVNLFLRGGVDVASAMWYNEYHTILNTGIDPEELTVFPLSEYGLNFPEDGLYMQAAAYRKNPSLAAACVKASLEGWRYAFDHPEETLDIVIQYMQAANLSANRTHQRWMLSRMADLILPVLSADPGAMLRKADFDSVCQFLYSTGQIEKVPDYDAFTGDIHVSP